MKEKKKILMDLTMKERNEQFDLHAVNDWLMIFFVVKVMLL